MGILQSPGSFGASHVTFYRMLFKVHQYGKGTRVVADERSNSKNGAPLYEACL